MSRENYCQTIEDTKTTPMEKDLPTYYFSSSQEAIASVDRITETFKKNGVLVLKGHSYTTEEQVSLVRAVGDILNWNVCSDAAQEVVDSSIYPGGHSEDENRPYNLTKDQYVLDWHIEQVYYLHPILAGIWNMTKFDTDKENGNTRFVDSIEIFKSYSEEEQDFLAKSIVKWDKQSPLETGPYYTNVVELHPISGEPVLRVETDQGCILYPELYALDGKEATEEQKIKFSELQDRLKAVLINDESLRYSQKWEQGDLLFVDLFRMYHAVMGGFNFGERAFTGIGIRPKVYDYSLHKEPRLV